MSLVTLDMMCGVDVALTEWAEAANDLTVPAVRKAALEKRYVMLSEAEENGVFPTTLRAVSYDASDVAPVTQRVSMTAGVDGRHKQAARYVPPERENPQPLREVAPLVVPPPRPPEHNQPVQKPAREKRSYRTKSAEFNEKERSLISERMRAVLNQLGYNRFRGGVDAMRKCGLLRSVWHGATKTGKGVTRSVVAKFCAGLEVSEKWLVTGEGGWRPGADKLPVGEASQGWAQGPVRASAPAVVEPAPETTAPMPGVVKRWRVFDRDGKIHLVDAEYVQGDQCVLRMYGKGEIVGVFPEYRGVVQMGKVVAA